MSGKRTQCQRLMAHLLANKAGITAGEWAEMTYSTELRARISDLRRDGATIWSVNEKNPATGTKWKRYFLVSLVNYSGNALKRA